jgi:chromosome segregation ATPase
MTYLKKTTTFTLFLALAIALVVFILSAYYYQISLTKLNDLISSKDNQITVMTGQIIGLNSNMSDLREVLDLQIKREENLSGLFLDLQVQNDNVEKQRRSIETTFNQTQAALYAAQTKVEDLEDSLSQTTTKYISMNNTYSKMHRDILDICDKASELNISECRNY